MADSRAANSKTCAPGVGQYARNVYGVVPDRIFLRKEAMYGVQCSFSCSGHPNML